MNHVTNEPPKSVQVLPESSVATTGSGQESEISLGDTYKGISAEAQARLNIEARRMKKLRSLEPAIKSSPSSKSIESDWNSKKAKSEAVSTCVSGRATHNAQDDR